MGAPVEQVALGPLTEDAVLDLITATFPGASGRARLATVCHQKTHGNAFFLRRLLESLSEESLSLPLASGLLVPAAEATTLASDPLREAARVTFRFAHDRVRQAARSLVDDEGAASIHLRVARFMLARLDENEGRLFELVEHLNQGLTGEVSAEDAKLLRSLNLAAARRATASAAFEAAYRYMRRALTHLAPDPWENDYAQTFAMHVEGARSAYLGGDHATMRALVEVAEQNAQNVLDRVSAREVELHALVSQQRLVEAVRLSVELQSLLGLRLSASATREDVEHAVGATLARLEGVTADDLARIPMALDPAVVAILRIQNDTMSSAYLAAPNLLPIMGCNIVQMTLDSGVCKESPYGFAILGLVLCAGNMIDVAYEVGKLAVELLGRIEDRCGRRARARDRRDERGAAAYVAALLAREPRSPGGAGGGRARARRGRW